MFRKFKKFFKKFFLIDDNPQKIAGGAALGIFLGLIPGIGALIAILIASIFRLNKLAAATGAFAVNTWATFLILPPSAAVGSFLFNENYSTLVNEFKKINEITSLKSALLFSTSFFSKYSIPLAVGFFIVSGAIGIGAYFLILYILKKKKIDALDDVIKISRKK